MEKRLISASLTPCSLRGRSVTRWPRDRELLADYRKALQEVLREGVSQPRLAAIRLALKRGKPRYHISFERAYLVTCAVLREGRLPLRPSLRAQMWHEFVGHVRRVKAERGLSTARAVEHVLLHCRASRHWISERYADRHLYRAARETRECLRRRHARFAGTKTTD